jgi:hypothetical protein
MSTEAGQTALTPTHSRDTPLHLDSALCFELTNLKVSEALEEVRGPIFHLPKDTKIVHVKPEEIHEFFSPPHYSKHEIQLQTEAATEYELDYLRRSEFEQTARLACSDFKRLLLAEASEVVRRTI